MGLRGDAMINVVSEKRCHKMEQVRWKTGEMFSVVSCEHDGERDGCVTWCQCLTSSQTTMDVNFVTYRHEWLTLSATVYGTWHA